MFENGIVLFGVKSPAVVEYEESLARAGISLRAGVSLGGPVRLLNRKASVEIDKLPASLVGAPCLPCAFLPIARKDLAGRAEDVGLKLSEALVDPASVVASSSRLGKGTYVNAGTIIGGATLLGDLVFVNRSSSLGHHCVVSNLVSIGPGVTIASNVRIGEGSVIGAGAVILPDLRIGDGAIVSGGAVVRRDVAPGTIVSGNPARPRGAPPGRTSLARSELE